MRLANKIAIVVGDAVRSCERPTPGDETGSTSVRAIEFNSNARRQLCRGVEASPPRRRTCCSRSRRACG